MRQPNDKHFVLARGRNVRVAIFTAAIIASSVVVTVLSAALSEAFAKTKVDGDREAISLTAEEAPVSEVLAALSAKFGFVYTPAPGLDRTVGGTYSGTFQEVLERVLDGCDYVVSYDDDKIELKILGRSSSVARPSLQPSYSSVSPVVDPPPPPRQVSAQQGAPGVQSR